MSGSSIEALLRAMERHAEARMRHDAAGAGAAAAAVWQAMSVLIDARVTEALRAHGIARTVSPEDEDRRTADGLDD